MIEVGADGVSEVVYAKAEILAAAISDAAKSGAPIVYVKVGQGA